MYLDELIKRLRAEIALPYCAIKDMRDAADAIEELMRKCEQLPSADAVPVVRCKDCKRWKDPHDGECPYHATGDPYIDGDPEEDFFCAYGERKDDE